MLICLAPFHEVEHIPAMLVNRGFKSRAYPTEAQRQVLAEWFGCKRFVSNLAIDQRSMFSRRGRSISYNMQATDLPMLRAELEWLKACPAQILQQALGDVDKAYQRFFEGKGGYPRKRANTMGTLSGSPRWSNVRSLRRTVKLSLMRKASRHGAPTKSSVSPMSGWNCRRLARFAG